MEGHLARPRAILRPSLSLSLAPLSFYERFLGNILETWAKYVKNYTKSLCKIARAFNAFGVFLEDKEAKRKHLE